MVSGSSAWGKTIPQVEAREGAAGALLLGAQALFFTPVFGGETEKLLAAKKKLAAGTLEGMSVTPVEVAVRRESLDCYGAIKYHIKRASLREFHLSAPRQQCCRQAHTRSNAGTNPGALPTPAREPADCRAFGRNDAHSFGIFPLRAALLDFVLFVHFLFRSC